ncbi:MAG: peptidylprolyl isomerase, partial [Chloroflexota bacterium]
IQAALEAGLTVEEARIDQEILSLIEAAEGRENFEAWLERNFYTEEELRQEIAFGILYGPLVSEVAASVPTTSDQVRASYIKVADEALANTLLTQIQSGESFANLANQHSIPELTNEVPTGGDVGFFGIDWPLQNVPPTFQEVAFSLDAGQSSLLPPNQEADGLTYYYIIQTTERDPQHPIPQPRLDQLRQESILAWTEMLRQNADIVILVELGS